MLTGEGCGYAATLVQLLEADLGGVINLRCDAFEHLEEALTWRNAGFSSSVERFENSGLLSGRTPHKRLVVFADGIPIHPPQTLAETGLFVFGGRRQDVIDVMVDQRSLRAGSVSGGN